MTASTAYAAWWRAHDAELLERWHCGETQAQIGAALGVHMNVVRCRLLRLRKQGVAVRPPRGGTTAERVPELIRRWRAGETKEKVAAALGLTPGQVMGAVFRLRQDGVLGTRRPHQTAAAREAAAARLHAPPPPKGRIPDRVKAARPTLPKLASLEVPQAPPPEPAPRRGKVEPCCWIEGNRKPFHYCEAMSEPGRPYCTEHAGRAYRPRSHAA